MPRVLRWVPSASLIKHGFEGLCASEFPGLAFEPAPAGGGRGDLTDGDQARYPGSCCKPGFLVCAARCWRTASSMTFICVGQHVDDSMLLAGICIALVSSRQHVNDVMLDCTYGVFA